MATQTAYTPPNAVVDDPEGQGEAPLLVNRRNEDISPQDAARRLPRGLRQKKASEESAPQRAWMQAGQAAISVSKSFSELRRSVDDPKSLEECEEALEALRVGLQQGLGPVEFDTHYTRLRDVKERLETPVTFSTEVRDQSPAEGQTRNPRSSWVPKRVSLGAVAERVSDSRGTNASGGTHASLT